MGSRENCFKTLQTLCCVQAPPKDSKDLFLQHAALEEQYGLARTAMEVYDRAVQTVPQDQRLSVYDLYLARASQFFGIAKVGLYQPPSPVRVCSVVSAAQHEISCPIYAA